MIRRQKPPLKFTQTFEFPPYISDKPVPLTILISDNDCITPPDLLFIYDKLVFALLDYLKSHLGSTIDFSLYTQSPESNYNPDSNYIHMTPGNITIRVSPLTPMLSLLLTAAEMNSNYITGSFTLKDKIYNINYTCYADNGTSVIKTMPFKVSGLPEPLYFDVQKIDESFIDASKKFNEELTKKLEKSPVKSMIKKLFKSKWKEELLDHVK